MSTDKLILTDIDQTVLQFCAPFSAYAKKRRLRTKGKLGESYDICAFLQRDRPAAEKVLQEFMAEAGRNQPAEPCAAAVLPTLHAEGYRFVGISACGMDYDFRAARLVNLADAFGFPFEDLHTVPHEGTKRDVLTMFEPAIWVEDHFPHAVTGADLGHRTFLLDKPYNQGLEHEGVTRVADWHEIYAHLHADAQEPPEVPEA